MQNLIRETVIENEEMVMEKLWKHVLKSLWECPQQGYRCVSLLCTNLWKTSISSGNNPVKQLDFNQRPLNLYMQLTFVFIVLHLAHTSYTLGNA